MYTSQTVIPDPPIQLLSQQAVCLDEVLSVHFSVASTTDDTAVVYWKNPNATPMRLEAEDARRLFMHLGGEIETEPEEEPEEEAVDDSVPLRDYILNQMARDDVGDDTPVYDAARVLLDQFVGWIQESAKPRSRQTIVDAFLGEHMGHYTQRSPK